MRCLSPSANYSIQVFEGDERIVVDQAGVARQINLTSPVIANFEQRGLLDHEIEEALEHFNFSGVPEGVNPLTRISSFDTEAYVQRFPEEEQETMIEKMDKRLRQLQGMFPGEFIIVDQPAAKQPWPSYDGDTAEEILDFQERLGINPETVRLYELEHENRSEVVQAMLERENPELAGAVEEITVSA